MRGVTEGVRRASITGRCIYVREHISGSEVKCLGEVEINSGARRGRPDKQQTKTRQTANLSARRGRAALMRFTAVLDTKLGFNETVRGKIEADYEGD